MSNGKKKRKRPSGSTSTYRAPAQADQPRRGLLDGLLAPTGEDDDMPVDPWEADLEDDT